MKYERIRIEIVEDGEVVAVIYGVNKLRYELLTPPVKPK
jgi:hypothetical protein